MQKALLFLFSIIILSSCKFNPNFQGKGADMLQGRWEEDTIRYQDSLLQHTKHHFKFSCDSFYLTLSTRSKVNIYPDSCYNNGSWTEYVKGTYAVKGDSLYLYGTFTNAGYKQKISGCYRIGTFKPIFLIEQSDSHLTLHSLTEHFPVRLKLKERTTCTPKPL